MLNQSRVVIIIVTYNGEKYLSDLFNSLSRQDYSLDKIDVIVVDNYSTDDTVNFIKNNYPSTRIIINQQNLGFTKANNQGIKLAQDIGADYVFFLNQDTICTDNLISSLVNALDNNSQLGIVQPLLLFWPKQELINTAGNQIHFLGFGYCGDYKKRIEATNYLSEQSITYASGAALMIRRALLDKLGGFDELFFMYHEDLDLGWRARLLGYQIALISQTIIYHKHKFDLKGNKQKNYCMETGRLIVLLKNYRWLTLVLLFPWWLIMELGLHMYFCLLGQPFIKIKSYLKVFSRLPRILRHRRILQRQRVVKDKQIICYFTGKVKFADLNNPILTYLVNPVFNLSWQIIKKIIFW